jgi:hypothetical protein
LTSLFFFGFLFGALPSAVHESVYAQQSGNTATKEW